MDGDIILTISVCILLLCYVLRSSLSTMIGILCDVLHGLYSLHHVVALVFSLLSKFAKPSLWFLPGCLDKCLVSCLTRSNIEIHSTPKKLDV